VNKKYRLQVHEKTYLVELEETNDGSISVVIDGKPHLVELERSDIHSASFSIVIDGKPHLVELERSDIHSASFSVVIDGKPHIVKLESIEATSRLSTPTDVVVMEDAIEGVIKAPMVGQVVLIQITPGDSIKQGDVLLILEAMKMENEIRASKNGIIKEVRVSEGEMVNMGDILVIIE